jgi:hypothetical protein
VIIFGIFLERSYSHETPSLFTVGGCLQVGPEIYMVFVAE